MSMLPAVTRFTRILALVTALLAMATGTVVAQSPAATASPVVIGERTVLVVQLGASDGAPITSEQQAAALEVMTARLAALGATGSTVAAIPDGRVRIDIGDPTQMDAITRVATARGELSFLAIPDDPEVDVQVGEALPDGMPQGVIVGPGHVAHAAVGRDELDRPAVELTLDDEAAQAFDAWAAGHQGALMALVLDDIVTSVATINAPRFEGQIVISGTFEEPLVAELTAILDGGVMPVAAEPLIVCPIIDACPVPSAIPSASPPASAAP